MNLQPSPISLALAVALLAFQDPPARTPPAQEPAPLSDAAQAALNVEMKRKARALEEEEFFKRSDQNGNGWISLRESQDSLGLDTSSFRAYDTDLDGRITRAEFSVRYLLSVSRVGAFKPPVAAPTSARAPTRNAEQLRIAYDKNDDGGLAPEEMAVLLTDYERSELPAEIAVEKLDRDGSTRVDGGEIDVLARLLTSAVQPAAGSASQPLVPQTLEELFGGLRDRSSGYQTAPTPPQIDGPVRHFRRLDLDGNGRVSNEDLRRLMSPLDLPVRAGAVLAALDADGDGELSPEEFAAALVKS